MRSALHVAIALGLAISAVASAQSPTESQFLLRLKYIKTDAPTDVATNCLAVFPDGRFHLEKKSLQPEVRPESKAKIYEGSLSESSLKSLVTLIDDPELRDLKGMERHTVIFSQGERGEIVWVFIQREDRTQKLLFSAQTGTPKQPSRDLPKPVSALVAWNDERLRELNRNKVHALKNAREVSCWMAKDTQVP